jgi:hypothetical protein
MRMTSEETKELLDELNPLAMFCKGMDAGLIGVAYRIGGPAVALYDRDKCVDLLIEQGFTPEGAFDAFDSPTLSAPMLAQENAPMFALFV